MSNGALFSQAEMRIGSHFLQSIRCPNHRGRPKNKEYDSNAICNRFLAQIEPSFTGKLILYCPSCSVFFLLNKTENCARLELIDKKDIDFKNELKCEIGGYQSKI